MTVLKNDKVHSYRAEADLYRLQNPDAVTLISKKACDQCGGFKRYIASPSCAFCRSYQGSKARQSGDINGSCGGRPPHLSFNDLDAFCHAYYIEFKPIRQIAEMFGCSYTTVRDFLVKSSRLDYWDQSAYRGYEYMTQRRFPKIKQLVDKKEGQKVVNVQAMALNLMKPKRIAQ